MRSITRPGYLGLRLIICPLSEQSYDPNPHMQTVKNISSEPLRGVVGREALVPREA